MKTKTMFKVLVGVFVLVQLLLISVSFYAPPLVGYATSSDITICINTQHSIPPVPPQDAIVGQLFTLQINASDINNDTLYYVDNTTLFNINSSTGVINFTPATTGSYSILINVTETSICETVTKSITFDLNITVLNITPQWANLSFPRGIYEPLCCGAGNATSKSGEGCLDGTYNPLTGAGDLTCEGSTAGNNDPLDLQHIVYITFENLTITPFDTIACMLEYSNRTLFRVNETGLSMNSTDYRMNYTIHFDDSLIRDTGVASMHDVPWYFHNCTITAANGTQLHYQNLSRRVFTHRSTVWTAFDYQKAVFCESVPFKFFNNTALCSLATIGVATKSYERNLAFKKVAGAPVEMHCHDEVDNDNDGAIDSADIDCLTFADQDNISFYPGQGFSTRGFFDGWFRTWSSTADADNIGSGTIGSTNFLYTVNTNSSQTFKTRIYESSPGTDGYGYTLKDVPDVGTVNIIGDGPGIADAIVSTSCISGLCNVNYDCSGASCKVNTVVDLVVQINFTNTSLDGISNITLQVVHGTTTEEGSFSAYFDPSDGLSNNNESDNSSVTASNLCSDGTNNDLDISYTYTAINASSPFNRISYSRDCADADCSGFDGPSYAPEQDISFTQGVCQYLTEVSCADGYDNDFNDNYTTDAFGMQGNYYTDCHDIDCFRNGVECPLTETICNDGLNNDWDYVDTEAESTSGHKIGNTNNAGGTTWNGLKYSHTSRTANLQDCEEPDCNGLPGTGGICEWAHEINCTDGFSNDALQTADCVFSGSNYGTQGGGAPAYGHAEYDCSTSCQTQYPSNATENGTFCDDGIDNDWDYWSNTNIFSGTANGGIDCGWNGTGRVYNPDTDCHLSNMSNNKLCELGTELSCGDSFDNDYDNGFNSNAGWSAAFYNAYFSQFGMSYSATADCDDYDCAGLGNCPTNEAINASWCFDGADNDLDGPIDCNDPDCIGVVNPADPNEACLTSEFNATLFTLNATSPNYCTDLVDNDERAADNWNAASASYTYNSFGETYTDNGGSQYPDCRDLDCYREFGACGPCSSIEFMYWNACFDGLDNDHDSSLDTAEADCAGQIINNQGFLQGQAIPELCTNFFDDDSDSATDCRDSECTGQLASPDGRVCGSLEAGTETTCTDDFDNDNDGDIDCIDSDCYASCSMAVMNGEGLLYTPQNSSFSLTGGVTVNGQATSIVRRGHDLYVRFSYAGSSGAVDLYLGSPGTNEEIPTSIFNSSAATFVVQDGFTMDKSQAGSGQLRFVKAAVASFDFTVRIPGLGVLDESSTVKSTVEVGSNLGQGTFQTEVVNDVAPTLGVINVEPNQGKLSRGDTIDVVGGNFSGVSGGQSHSGRAGRCSISITGPSTAYSTNSNSCSGSVAITTSGTYNFTVIPYDSSGNQGGQLSTLLVPDVAPRITQNIPVFTKVHYNSTNGTLESETAKFETSRSESYSTSSCRAKVYNSAGSIVLDQQVSATLSDGNSHVTCMLTNSVASLVIDGPYYVTINATDSRGYSLETPRQVFFMCNSVMSSGSGWNCSLADFDTDKYTEGTMSLFTYNGTTPYCDNCPGVYNPDQADNTSNGFGNLCDPGLIACGNGVVEAGEQCDDGNVVSGDGCSATCQTEVTGGRGGGGGCFEHWVCDEWSQCIDYVQTRECEDIRECGTEYFRPPLSRSCFALPSCKDKIQNQNEEGIDCGGWCAPCPNCSDNILNQDEEDIDCGGVCTVCPTCFDLIKNQNELDIDCGGPCDACLPPVLQMPSRYVRGFCVGKLYNVCLTTTLLIFIAAILGILLLHGTRPKKKDYWDELNGESK